ncbi:3-deoxy-7-phosphoheptulonate synthase [Permianibacter sp. IMCC34836]|uniref:3-deoxy-7-phosphoheptulonate synthase n=1 Tax=Permianibacter fluminis TaxID=2738515 RepID=UPI0015568C00|nr:3-deoxy-7-phosphoheptulonate synthase [Permianibacter fluminis]NQD38369.1 3-deoxy-7-phosphoheptulonate synthase [Permianibacter fluminis]
MIVVLKPEANEADAFRLMQQIEARGLKPLYMPGVERVVLGALGDERVLNELNLEGDPLVESVKPILTPYKLVSRDMRGHDTVVNIGKVAIGGERIVVVGGPCAVESEDQLRETAAAVKDAGARALRGGAYKPRSSPYSFQGHGEEGLNLLQKISGENGLPTISEVMDTGDVELFVEKIDALQIGARNMQNFRLLRAVGETKKPVVLKRGLSATIEELLLAAEYIVAAGNPNVILCERGIRTFETATRNTLDLNAVAYLKQKSHLPVLVDPSHGTGIRELVAPLSKAALACGADGLLIEVHRNPAQALSDGKQSLTPPQFAQLMKELKLIAEAVGRTL